MFYRVLRRAYYSLSKNTFNFLNLKFYLTLLLVGIGELITYKAFYLSVLKLVNFTFYSALIKLGVNSSATSRGSNSSVATRVGVSNNVSRTTIYSATRTIPTRAYYLTSARE
ncbi:hypothetical protein HDK77DRAFT_429060 [Phyllosticta capitalensis]